MQDSELAGRHDIPDKHLTLYSISLLHISTKLGHAVKVKVKN